MLVKDVLDQVHHTFKLLLTLLTWEDLAVQLRALVTLTTQHFLELRIQELLEWLLYSQ